MKRPSFQFYPNDWLNDTALRMCSLAARGLWADMMSIMHDCTPYGHLVVNGKGILPAYLARRVGASLAEIEPLLEELREHGVYGVSPEGLLFSRRMVRDEYNRQVRAAGGVKSLENPNVPRPKADKGKDTFRPSPSSSPSSSSPSSSKPFLEDFEVVWPLYPKRSGANSKRDAYFAYRARRKNGATADEIREGVERYAKYIRATGKEGTEFVKMAASFFGPSAPYLEEWTPPAANDAKPHLNGKATTSRAIKLVSLIRDRRNPLYPNSVVADWQTGLSNSDIQVCKTFGLPRILNDTNEGTMVAQLTKALEESSHG